MNSRRTRTRSVLAVILTVLVLAPAAVLFARVWQENSDDRAQLQLERKGVQYLTVLTPLISALAEAQSSAVQGVQDPPDSLTGAVTKVAAVDAQIGDDLRTKQRWADIQGRIGKLPNVTGGTLAVYQAHVEVADLTLELYSAVRRYSSLARDPQGDISNLQQAVAVDMPATMIQVSQMGDLAGLLEGATDATRKTLAAQFGVAVLSAQGAVNRLTDTLQNAVDDTTSTTLSGSLVNTLDSFRRGVESMTRGANPGGEPNVATMSTAQTALQSSLTTLAGVVLKEIDSLLSDRQDALNYRRWEALGAGVLAFLLALGAVLTLLLKPRSENGPPAGPDDAGPTTTDRPGAGYGQYNLPPNYGDFDPTRRERSGALR
jgi:hypothetical protein